MGTGAKMNRRNLKTQAREAKMILTNCQFHKTKKDFSFNLSEQNRTFNQLFFKKKNENRRNKIYVSQNFTRVQAHNRKFRYSSFEMKFNLLFNNS